MSLQKPGRLPPVLGSGMYLGPQPTDIWHASKAQQAQRCLADLLVAHEPRGLTLSHIAAAHSLALSLQCIHCRTRA